jgi:phosphatidylglycerophosphate synthase
MPELTPTTLTDVLRQNGNALLKPIARQLHRWRVHPDTITFVGLGVVFVACLAIAQGRFPLGGFILLMGLPLDALDGAVAREMERKGQFGAVLDSALDRYADGFIFASLSYYFAMQGQSEWLIVSQVALIGTFAVSYLRARGEGVGLMVKIGLFSRVERTLIMIPMLLLPALLEAGLLVLAIGTQATALQRLWYIYKTLKAKGE